MKTSGSAMAERPRDACSAILRGWVTLNLDFRLKGYVLCQRLWTVRWGNGYTTTFPLDVLTQRNFVADVIRLKLNFIEKNLLRHPLGNVCTVPIACWKASGQIPVRQSGCFSKGVDHFEHKFQMEGASPTNRCWCQKT